jgi:flagellin
MDIVEGSYSSIMDNLIEMKGLATQAANDTLSSAERTLIAKQINGLGVDINATADAAKFNGISLLPSATGQSLTFQVGEGTSDTMSIDINKVDIVGLFGADNTDLANNNDISVAVSSAAPDNTELTTDQHARGEIEFEMDGTPEVTADATDFNTFMTKVDVAIGTLNGYFNELGIDQRSLSGKEVNLTEAISANSAAKSRIMDVDFAKEQSNSVRLQILQQTATAALSQANMGPQAVLGFLGQ